jgi:hypothetical protein
MARKPKSAGTAQRTPRGRKPGRPAATPAKTAVSGRASASVKATAAPKVSKDELRGQVEKLERANAALRAKGREANRDAKSSAARVAELEGEVARLEKKLASQAKSAQRPPKPRTVVRGKRQSAGIDPGDAVPPGVAVQDPAPLDAEAETARENLEEQLGE